MFYAYILINAKGRYYIGQTSDLNRRLFQHNNYKFSYTKKGRPWRLLYSESFNTRREAVIRERQIKSYKSGSAFKKLIKV